MSGLKDERPAPRTGINPNAVTYPVELPPSVGLLYQRGMPYDFVLSWSNSYRSLDFANIPMQPDFLPVGSLIDGNGVKATTVGDIAALTCFAVDATVGPDRVTIVSRETEVNDAYIAYGTLPRDQVNEHLREVCGIIVREGIVPNVMNATFAGQGGFLP